WDITRRCHHDIGLHAFIVASLSPDADAFGAMRDGLVHRHVLKMLLLVGNDDIDIVGALEAMVSHAKQRVGVGRQIDAANVRAFVHDYVEESRILMRKTIVILSPNR